nr:sugar transporter stl1 [Quercus suber]
MYVLCRLAGPDVLPRPSRPTQTHDVGISWSRPLHDDDIGPAEFPESGYVLLTPLTLSICNVTNSKPRVASANCIPWVYVPEILPLHARAKGTAIGISSNWLWNFVIVMITPTIINSLAWKAYLIFMCTNLAFVPLVYFCYPETSNLTLEEVDHLFTTTATTEYDSGGASRGMASVLRKLKAGPSQPVLVSLAQGGGARRSMQQRSGDDVDNVEKAGSARTGKDGETEFVDRLT